MHPFLPPTTPPLRGLPVHSSLSRQKEAYCILAEPRAPWCSCSIGNRTRQAGVDKSTHRAVSLEGLMPKTVTSNKLQKTNGYIYGEEYSQHQLRNIPEEDFLYLFKHLHLSWFTLYYLTPMAASTQAGTC